MLNPTMRKRTYIVNREGYDVYEGKPDMELFLMASNLKPKGTFYEDNTVKAFMEFMERLPKGEYNFAVSLANFLSEMGIKLAPVVMLEELSRKGVDLPESCIKVFSRPDKVANYIYLSKLRGKKPDDGFRNLSKKERLMLRKALESMKPATLVKMQLKGRKIKTRDLIKMLRPKPKDEDTSKRYRAIIENRARIETLLTKRSKDEKVAVEYFEENIGNMPVNMLIRNLRMYKKAKNPAEARSRILKRLEDISASEKVVNPFDFVTVAIEEPSLELEMTTLIKRFVKSLIFTEFGKTAVLFDTSGSMEGRGEEDGFKNLALLTHIFNPEDLYFFACDLSHADTKILRLIKEGNILRAKELMRPSEGGTALMDAFESLASDSRYDNIIVISDEVTWADSEEIDSYRDVAKGKKVIAINPVKYEGTAFRDKFLALASIEAKIMLFIKIIADWEGFKKWVIDNYY